MTDEDGTHDEFIKYLFSQPPKEKKEISLELPLENSMKNVGLHIFEQLLMIFTDGVKYFYGDNNIVDINKLNKENIEKINKYFISFGYEIKIEVFDSIDDYQFKFPNYFKNKEHIKIDTKLEDFFYEIFNASNIAYRISFTSI
tara:strand:+ start:3496 stop:3924 length:429 start_codon:yes stop_codon:yes gene_type:complete